LYIYIITMKTDHNQCLLYSFSFFLSHCLPYEHLKKWARAWTIDCRTHKYLTQFLRHQLNWKKRSKEREREYVVKVCLCM
jgi:hypothetical protein